MNAWAEKRIAIAALIEAGKTNNAIAADLKCSRSLVLKVKRRLAAGKDLQPSPRKAKKPVLTSRVVGGLKKRIKAAPTKSLCRVAKEANVSRESVRRVVRGAGWRSLRKVKVPLISSQGRQTRIERANGLINALKSAAPGKIVFFSDEKTFVVDPAFNPQNDRWIRFDDAENDAGDLRGPTGKFLPRSKHPAGAMLLAAVASTGERSPPIWFPEGFRLGADDYIEALKKTLIPWMRRVAVSRGSAAKPAPFIFQQDSAPAHRAKKTLAFLEEEKISFWKPTQWPPNSPDLNPMDYAIWSMVVQGAGDGRPSSVPAMKRKINAAWRAMDPEKIRAACRSFRPRLSRCIEEKGSFFD